MPENALYTAVSGLNAATRRLDASANNIANAGTVGRVGAQAGDADQAFQAQTVQQTSTTGGGTRAAIVPRNPATQTVFAPDSPLANGQGLVEAPNVDLGEELVNQISAEAAFKANAAVIRSVDEQQDDLLDILS
ncbi:flagellar basal body rod protein FlgC [Hwanghaeella sp.]|uniref:flagellar basal body rod protein FlgC n=1 Tax=Hwanghaeella sp. TaxID=2605943 RepID=UPI003CCC2014